MCAEIGLQQALAPFSADEARQSPRQCRPRDRKLQNMLKPKALHELQVEVARKSDINGIKFQVTLTRGKTKKRQTAQLPK